MSICNMFTYLYRLKGKGPQDRKKFLPVSDHCAFQFNSDNLKSQASPLDKDIAPRGNSVGPGAWIRASSEVPSRGNRDSVWRHRPQLSPPFDLNIVSYLFVMYLLEYCNVM